MSGCRQLEEIRARVEAAAVRSGRNPEEIRILAVSKKKPLSAILQAFGCGQRLFGENYIQEAVEKIEALGQDVRSETCWHFIGHLQRNKAKFAVNHFDCVETLDSIKLARELSKRALNAGRQIEVMIQVNIGKDPAKSGIMPEEAEEFLDRLEGLSGLSLTGLMTMPPFTTDMDETRGYFRALRRLRDRLDPHCRRLRELSMGMSRDFEVAIEEGATIVRIGTALFGPRE